MKVAVIIPVYNEEKNIINCLKSLEKQTLNNFEVIVIDDGSVDKTLDILFKYNSSKYKLIIKQQKHQGPAMARNLGAKNTKANILVFVDADMTFDINFLNKLISPILNKNIVGTFSKEEYVSNWDNVWSRCWNFNLNLPIKKRLSNNYPNKQKVFRAIKKTEFDKVGGFDKGGYTDDWSLSNKLNALAINAKGAKFYHKNPDNLIEVFKQAKWVGKRKYKFRLFGILFTLLKSSLLVSLFIGILKAIKIREFNFILFKIIYDFGIHVGILEFVLFKKGAK